VTSCLLACKYGENTRQVNSPRWILCFPSCRVQDKALSSWILLVAYSFNFLQWPCSTAYWKISFWFTKSTITRVIRALVRIFAPNSADFNCLVATIMQKVSFYIYIFWEKNGKSKIPNEWDSQMLNSWQQV
jgi:hypothetical protein